MQRWIGLIAMGGCLAVSGCKGKEPRAANDRVQVRAPFVNVNVGEEGGVKVRAPFTNVETPRYQQSYSSPANDGGAARESVSRYGAPAPTRSVVPPAQPLSR